ncbi:hypothetical protein [Acinetobacter sp. YH12239]|uniref:AbiTii domain-containing protein n=1 Tax=Acinetobacter sp. YH12239 TaxID=2601166 RepID=UPI0015D2BB1A|nr:hypothetical protein [Acinetobacter sp. YH12239]
MSLLREIQNDAVNTDVKVSDLLRKCKILSYRLGNDSFKKWVESELNGYPDEEVLPLYRVLQVASKGNFVGSFGSSLSNADMPMHGLPEKLKDDLLRAQFNQPIATVEGFINDGEGYLTQSWNPIILAKYGSNMYTNLNCIQAWKIISIASVIGIVDTVKTRILNFALEIEAINPEAGEASLISNPISQDKISQIFNINISGSVGNLASGNHQSTIHQATSSSQIPSDFIELLRSLKKSDLEEEIVLELEKRIESLGNSVGKEEYNENYKDLMAFASNHVTVLTFLATYIPMLVGYL